MILVLEVLSFYLDSNQNTSLLEKCLDNSFEKPYSFWNDLFPLSTNLSCHDLCANPLPQTLSPSLDHDTHQIQQVEPLHIIISIYLSSKTIYAFYLDPWRFSKELPFLLWVLSPNQFPFLVLWTLNQDPWRSTGLQFKIFKLYLLQVWTRFAKFDEIHSNLSPKILRKIRQPLGALRGHLTMSQLQENFSSHQIISSNTFRALSMSCSVKFS